MTHPNAERELRFSVECLPVDARLALLEAVHGGDLMTGVYESGGSVCPSVAVRRLGPTDRMAGLARAWDDFTGADGDCPRRATQAERRALGRMIEKSLSRERLGGRDPLREAVAGMARSRRGGTEPSPAAEPAKPRPGLPRRSRRKPPEPAPSALDELARRLEDSGDGLKQARDSVVKAAGRFARAGGPPSAKEDAATEGPARRSPRNGGNGHANGGGTGRESAPPTERQ
jgi:hypothetical protein